MGGMLATVVIFVASEALGTSEVIPHEALWAMWRQGRCFSCWAHSWQKAGAPQPWTQGEAQRMVSLITSHWVTDPRQLFSAQGSHKSNYQTDLEILFFLFFAL